MKAIVIEATEERPKVVLDAENNLFEISGRSFPPDSSEFYEPLVSWLNEYIREPNPHTPFHFKLEYFNSASQKYFFKVLSILQQLNHSGNSVNVIWHYKTDDDDLKAIGEEFEGFFDIKFSFTVY